MISKVVFNDNAKKKKKKTKDIFVYCILKYKFNIFFLDQSLTWSFMST